jgi:hypothetical protein
MREMLVVLPILSDVDFLLAARAVLQAIMIVMYVVVFDAYMSHRDCWRFPFFITYLLVRMVKQAWIAGTGIDGVWPVYWEPLVLTSMGLASWELLGEIRWKLGDMERKWIPGVIAGTVGVVLTFTAGWHLRSGESLATYKEIREVCHQVFLVVAIVPLAWIWIYPKGIKLDQLMLKHWVLWVAYLGKEVVVSFKTWLPTDSRVEWLWWNLGYLGAIVALMISWDRLVARSVQSSGGGGISVPIPEFASYSRADHAEGLVGTPRYRA